MLIKKIWPTKFFVQKMKKMCVQKVLLKKIGSGRLLVFSNIWVKKILREKKLVSN